ncbi:MAG: hypothetical protein U0704_13420 [Candidatus Eisenbacteria bacterium]
MRFGKLPFLLLAALACTSVAPRVAHAADADSVRVGVGVMSRRALIDLHSPSMWSPAAERTADSLHLPVPGAATAITIAGAVVPGVVFSGVAASSAEGVALGGAIAASVIGPGLGYYYGGIGAQALPGQLVRTGALGGLAAIWIYAWDSESAGIALIPGAVACAALYVGATLYDIGNVGPAVERQNVRRVAAARPDLALRTLHDGSPAVAVRVRF